MQKAWLVLLLLIPSLTQASDLAGGVQKTYQDIQDWQSSFSQSTYVDLTDQTIKRQGSMTIKKPGKLRIDYEGEGARQYISNGKKIWVYSPGDSQVEVYSKIGKWVSKEALSFLEGLGNVETDFMAEEIQRTNPLAEMVVDRSLKLLLLTPRSSESGLSQVVLGIKPKTFLVQEMTFFLASGNKTHYLFNSITLNQAPADSLFSFVKPKGVKEVKGAGL